MQKAVREMFFVLEIMAFECGGVTCLHYEVNSSEGQLASYQTFLRSQIWLGEMFPDWNFFRINVKLG